MIRIIGGKLKGRKLFVAKGHRTRPTSDRTREAVFNILGPVVVDAVVLELFAGTGTFALESLSRGGRSAVLVDGDGLSVSVIRRNISTCGLDDRTRVIRWNIVNNLNCLQAYTSQFDLVFMDPPYDRNMVRPTLLNLLNTGSLNPTATIVIEHALGESIPEGLGALRMTDQRRYGKTLVSFFACVL